MTLRPAISVFLFLATLCAASGSMPDWWRGNPDSNGDGRTDGEIFEAGGNPALDPAGDEAYGAVGFTVRIEGRAAARRAAVRIGPILHTGSRARRYRLPATVHTIELLDLDPASPEACSGRIVLTNDFTARLTLVRHTPADPHVDGRIVCDRVPGHSKVLMLAGFQDSVPFRWVGDAAEGRDRDRYAGDRGGANHERGRNVRRRDAAGRLPGLCRTTAAVPAQGFPAGRRGAGAGDNLA